MPGGARAGGRGPWGRRLGRLAAALATGLLRAADWLARRLPGLADVIVVAGRPR